MITLHPVMIQAFLSPNYKVTIVHIAYKYLCLYLVIVLVRLSQLYHNGYIFLAWNLLRPLWYLFISHTIGTLFFDSSIPTAAAFNHGVRGCSNMWIVTAYDKATLLHLEGVMRVLHHAPVSCQAILLMLTAPLRCFRFEVVCVRIAYCLDEAPGRLFYACATDGLHPGSCDAASAESVPFFAVSLLPRIFFYQLNVTQMDSNTCSNLWNNSASERWNASSSRGSGSSSGYFELSCLGT